MSEPSAAPPPPGRPSPLRPLAVGTGIMLLLGGALALWMRADGILDALAPDSVESRASVSSGPQATVEGVPERPGEPVVLTPPREQLVPAVWVEVYEPARLRDAAMKNEWLKETLAQPLGRGFLGPWAAFLGTRGEDLAGAFQGAVLDLTIDGLLNSPFYAVWFAGRTSAAGAPALIVPTPGDRMRAAFSALDKVARRGTFQAPTCPGAPLPNEGETAAPPPPAIHRWVIADHAVYAASAADRMVIGRNLASVLHGACAQIPPLHRVEGTHLSLAFDASALGREAQLLNHLAGIGNVARLGFRADGDRLTPTGILAQLATSGRLLADAPSPELLRLIPEDVPVLLTAQINLPRELSPRALEAHFAGKSTELQPRQVTLLWQPRGDASATSEIALIWNRVEDQGQLAAAFTGPNALFRGTHCKHLVFASTRALLERIELSCANKIPSLTNASEEVVAGLRRRSSVAVGIHLGRVLSQLALDGWRAEQPSSSRSAQTPPAELEEARRQLEQLPFLGFGNVLEGAALVPTGFRS